jgi:predicted enzyme related to lactoylglutathione lyase
LISAQYFAKALTMTSSIPLPKPIALVPELEVADFDRSMHFYVEVLGFVIQYDRPERPFAYLAFGDAHIMIEKGGGWMTGHLERPYGRGINFQIRVTEVKSVSERLAAAGWPVFQDIEDAWYRRAFWCTRTGRPGPGWLPLALLAGPGRSLSRGGKPATWSTSMAEASDLSWLENALDHLQACI